MHKEPMIILIGKTAAGKDAVARQLSKQLGYSIVTGLTTRPMRPREIDGQDHYFVSDGQFEKNLKAGVLTGLYSVQVFDNNGQPDIWRYGVPRAALGPRKILVSNPDSLDSILKAYPNSIVFCIEAEVEERRRRYQRRNPYASKKELERRVSEEEGAFARAYEKGLIDMAVDNTGDLETTVSTIKEFVEQL